MLRLYKFLLFLFFLVTGNVFAQTIVTDSARIAAYYNGTAMDSYNTYDTLPNGNIVGTYHVLHTPFDSLLTVRKGDHLTENKVIGIWVNDTIIPKIFRSYLVIAPQHQFEYHDSDVVWDSVSNSEVAVERILIGTWKISNDTFYTRLNGCLQGCNSSWAIDTGGWTDYVMVKGKLHKGPDVEEHRVYYAWRFRKEETFEGYSDEEQLRIHHMAEWRYGNKNTVPFDSLEYQSHVLCVRSKNKRFTGHLDGGTDEVSYYRRGKCAKRIFYYAPGKSKPRSVAKLHPNRMNGKSVNIQYDKYGRKIRKVIVRNEKPIKVITWDRKEHRRTVEYEQRMTQY